MKPALLAALSLALLIASSRGAVAQRFEHLSPKVQAEVKDLQFQLLLTKRLEQWLQHTSNRADSHVVLAREFSGSTAADVERAKHRKAIQADVRGFVDSGRGRKDLFEHWQLHYAAAGSDRLFAELIQDESLRPILLDGLRPLLSWSAKEDFFELSDDDLVARAEESWAASAASSRFLVSTIEPEVAPTDLERKHVRNESRQRTIEGACHYFLELRDPKSLQNLRVQIRYSQDRISRLWPAGNAAAGDPQLQAIAFKLMRDLRQW
jgi:hypothetical protein